MIEIELDLRHASDIFRRFSDIIGERYWNKRIKSIETEIKGNNFLNDYLAQKNEIAFSLRECSTMLKKFGKLDFDSPGSRVLYPALAYSAQVLSIIDHTSKEKRKSFIGRVRGAFENPDEIRAIRLEFAIATHFIRRGYTVQWPEMEGSGRFDLFVKNAGESGLEVECKSISNDKGRKIHKREAIDFFSLVYSNVWSSIKYHSSGLSVVITVGGRLPRAYSDRVDLAKHVYKAILSGKTHIYDDNVNFRIKNFDCRGITEAKIAGKHGRDTIDKITETKNRESVVFGTRAGGVIIFVLRSEKDDDFTGYIINTLKEASMRQVTGTRPASLLVGLDSVDADSLRTISAFDSNNSQTPTAIRRKTSRFLDSDKRDHIVCVGYLSTSVLSPKGDDHIDSEGSIYYFPKIDSPYWHPDFYNLFRTA